MNKFVQYKYRVRISSGQTLPNKFQISCLDGRFIHRFRDKYKKKYERLGPTLCWQRIQTPAQKLLQRTTWKKSDKPKFTVNPKRESSMAINAEGFSFEQRHGKERVRVGRVWKNRAGRYFFVEWNVSINLLSDCAAAYLRDDNSDIVATDTMKNTVCNSIVLWSLKFINERKRRGIF